MAKHRAILRPTLISLAIASCFTVGTALANPTGANVVRGTAAIHQAGNLLQITNSPNAIINWQSFSIGTNEITRFIQQSPSSAVLNRVTTQNPSTILGALQSNGRVFLINPNGILFGAGAQVDVAGLVASTLNLSDQDFLAGRLRFTDGLGKSVVNDGSIATGAGGSVYLIGSGVTNNGIIRSPQGEVVLAAGNSVELVSPGTPNLRVEIAATDNEARNLGQIISEAGRIGIYAGLINNSGSIRADSVVSEGGRILLKATKGVTLEDSSVLSAQGQGGGEIKVLADESVRVAGRLDASAPNGGDGGFIETSAATVRIAAGTAVTAAAPHGSTGTWLIDPNDFTIALSTGNIDGATLGANLNGANVTIDTVSQGTTGGNGDIFVNDFVSWTAANSLTLLAERNIELNSNITGGGDLRFFAGWNGASTTSPVVVSGVGDINISSDLTAGLGLGQGINPGDRNVWLLAGRDINLIGGVPRVQVVSGVGGTAQAVLQATAGNITMLGAQVLAQGSGIASVSGGAAGATLTAGGGINLMNNSSVSAVGAGGISGGSGTATLVAGAGITISGSIVTARGGVGASGAGGNATVTLGTGGDIALASSVNAIAGAGASGSPAGTAQIFLFLTTGDFSVNGIPGAIVGTGMGRVAEGFFVNGQPAIPDVNFFVTRSSDTPAFVDNLVASMNQQADALADQLRAGETGEDKDKNKKKLPFCSS